MNVPAGKGILAITACGCLATLALALGCGSTAPPEQPIAQPAAQQATGKPASGSKPAKKVARKQAAVPASKQPTPRGEERPAATAADRSLADLVAQAELEKAAPLDPMRFEPPQVDEAKCAARGIRKLSSKHLTLYTDLPASPEVDELPQRFDLAVPQWVAYFEIETARSEAWHMVGVVAQEKERFYETGLWPADLPPFLHGYMRSNQFWVYEQPSDYFRCHLVLHEGTHGFMWAFLGGVGPPWYAEGMAELLGTHRWDKGELTLNVVPPSKEAAPMWGRIKVLKEGYAASQALSLGAIMNYPPRAHLQTEPYAWCWGATVFFDHDPEYRAAFREARDTVVDASPTFSERLLNRLPQPRWQVAEQWQCFVANVEYGYDIARESIVRKETEPLPAVGSHIEVAADRGWQSSGYRVETGKTYSLTATGQFQVGRSTKPWISEANGITLRYYRGQPIGTLLAAVTDEGQSGGKSPLLQPVTIGTAGEITAEQDGVLYLRINDSPAERADNSGSLAITVKLKE